LNLKPAALLIPPVLLAFCGCMVGPDYKRPEMPAPSSWQELSKDSKEEGLFVSPVAEPEPVDARQWWRIFKDPTLDSLIERAVRGNLDLQSAEARIRAARAQRGVSKAALYPTIDNSDSYMRLHLSENAGELGAFGPFEALLPSPSMGAGSAAAAPPMAASRATPNLPAALTAQPQNVNFFQLGFDSSWEADLFGGIRRGIEAADAELDAAREERRNVLVTLLAELARDYVAWRGLQQQIEIARDNLASQQQTLEVVRLRFRSHLTPYLDVARAEAQVADTEAQLPALTTNAEQTCHRLAVLLGGEPGLLQKELTPAAPIPKAAQNIAVGLPDDLLNRRPDLRRAERKLASATARLGVATADLYPQLSLTNSAGWESIELSDFLQTGSKFWSIGPALSVPLFHGGAIRQRIHLQNALQEQAYLAYRATLLAAFQETEDALAAYANEWKRNELLAKEATSNKDALTLANQLYAGGLGDFLNVLDAQRSLLTSQAALAQSTQQLADNVIALYKALGGGWENVPGERPETTGTDFSLPATAK